MINRKQKVEELMENFQSLKRHMTFSSPGASMHARSRILKAPRITPSQWGVLMLIEQRGECAVKDVASTLSISSSAATQLIDGLIESKYVVKKVHAEDRRAVTLKLSKKTEAQVNAMKKHVVEKFLMMFEVLSDKEFNQYILLNKKIVERMVSKTK